MTLLALDTSTAWASVALYDGRSVLAEETWHAQRRHGDELFPTIERLLAYARKSLADVDRVAVATGPGSFTGLRVAIAAAQGIARGAGASLVGISTLDVLAYPHAQSKQRTCALLPAGRTEWYAAIYQERNRKWLRRSPYIVATLPDLLGPKALFAPPASRMRRAGYLAELGWRHLETAPQAKLGEIEPIYVKQPSIRAWWFSGGAGESALGSGRDWACARVWIWDGRLVSGRW